MATKYKRSRRNQTYRIWYCMIQRCHDSTHVSYKHYGARGIAVCEEWRGTKGFEKFLKEIGLRPNKKASLDRINPDLNYQPGNVRWVSVKEQNRNKRATVRIDDPDNPGQMITVGELAERRGYDYHKMRAILIRTGKWPNDPGPAEENLEDFENGDEDEDEDDE